MAKNKVLESKKNVIKKKAKPKTKKVIISDLDIYNRLKKWIPKIVYNTTSRYANGSMASIFNEADMTALAEDTALEVLRRVKVGLVNSKDPECVDLKGCESYFKTAFKNQCLKVYEKYAKTDIRAGIQTIGSDEAMAVATSKNLYSPEDSYLMNDQLGKVRKKLQESDYEYNKIIIGYAERNNVSVVSSEKQFYSEIFENLLSGFTAEEIQEKVGINNSDFLRQKRMLFEFVKNSFPDLLADMMEHFEAPEDYRVHTKDVNKRQKMKQLIKDLKPKHSFYIHTTVKENKFVATLYASISLYDRFDNKTNKVPSKLVKVKEQAGKNNIESMNKIKDNLWQQAKQVDIQSFIKKEADSYLVDVKNKEAV